MSRVSVETPFDPILQANIVGVFGGIAWVVGAVWQLGISKKTDEAGSTA